MKKVIVIILILAVAVAFVACSKKIDKNMSSEIKSSPNNENTLLEASKAEYHKITPEEAKKYIDEDKDMILLDVRSEAEYDESHIEGAVLIPLGELEKRTQEELGDTSATILIYCRSGVRSKNAANILVGMGYTKVYDFGGIIDYPYTTVTKG